MELSYWESNTWLKQIDFCIAGSGITGLSCALALREAHPKARILILEKGVFPQGASTRNAGFACFGSLTEILSDLQTHTEAELLELVSDRWKGIGLLRKRLGDAAMGYHNWGGYELFPEKDKVLFESTLDQMERINSLLHPVFGSPVFRLAEQTFGFRGVLPSLILNPLEGQLDTGRMMQALLEKARTPPARIQILTGVQLTGYEDLGDRVHIQTDRFELESKRLLLATNGFTRQLGDLPVRPARAQVLITAPVEGLPVRGTFHMDAGYYYFRNVGERLLLGGGRNLDPEGETTDEFGLTRPIQRELERLLREVILPGTAVEVVQRWSGIMGVGPRKKPLLKKLSENVACGVRLGGMGIAIGSHTGAALARLGAE